MSASIQSFLSNLDSHSGPAKSERFYVQFAPPPILNANLMRDLQYQCEVSEIPGIRVTTVDYRIYGPKKHVATGREYEEISFSIICTNDFYEKPLFDAWIDLINPQASGWDMNYKSIYAQTISLFQLDVTGNVIYGVNLINAFPIKVNSLHNRWADDSYHKLAVTFYYDRYDVIISNLEGFNQSTIFNGVNPTTSSIVYDDGTI